MGLKRFEEYRDALDKLSKAAQLELEDMWGQLDLSRPSEASDAVVGIMAALASKYGDMAALLSAEYYEGERAEAMGGGYRALLAPAADAGEVEKYARYACGHLFR